MTPHHHRASLPQSWSAAIATLVGVLLLGAALAWVTDSVTLQGERTIYTVNCVGGTWNGEACTGRLAAGDRYRYRALRIHREVLFWRPGASEASGRLLGCDIQDGRNWHCPDGPDAARSITTELVRGRAVREAGSGHVFHVVPKWRWLLLHWGLPAGDEADDGRPD
jgi:hypothetical protein